MKHWILGFLLSGVLSFSGSAEAQSMKSTSPFPLGVSRLWDIVSPDRITHFSIISGPSLDGRSRPNTFDGQENTGGINSWHQVSFQYQLTERSRFVINPRFSLDYNRLEESSSQKGTQTNIENPVLGISSVWLKYKNFTWSGSLNTVFLTLDEVDKQDGLLINPGGFQSLGFQVSSSLNMGSWVWARYRVFENNDLRAKLPMFVAPYLSYDFTDNVGMTAFYQFNGSVPSRSRLQWDPDDSLNVMLSFRLAKQLTLQPMVTLYRETDFRAERGNLNVWVSGQFF